MSGLSSLIMQMIYDSTIKFQLQKHFKDHGIDKCSIEHKVIPQQFYSHTLCLVYNGLILDRSYRTLKTANPAKCIGFNLFLLIVSSCFLHTQSLVSRAQRQVDNYLKAVLWPGWTCSLITSWQIWQIKYKHLFPSVWHLVAFQEAGAGGDTAKACFAKSTFW